MAAPRKLGGGGATSASLAAKQAASLVSTTLPGDAALPWDVVGEKLTELLGFLASVAQALAAELRERAASLATLARGALAVALPAAAAVAVLLTVCWCCGVAMGQGQRRRGPDGEEVKGLAGDGPVVSCRRGGYKGGIFSMHPNKPIVSWVSSPSTHFCGCERNN